MYTIQQLSKQLNISKPTLRFWEKEMNGLITPLRTRGGQRRYTQEHLNVMEKINSMRQDGLSLAEIRSILTDADSAHPSQNEIDVVAERIAAFVKQEFHGLLERSLNTQVWAKKE